MCEIKTTVRSEGAVVDGTRMEWLLGWVKQAAHDIIIA